MTTKRHDDMTTNRHDGTATIVVIGAEKGGVGKSTIATNLAVHLAAEGADVALLDADSQGTSAKWSDRRSESRPSSPSVPVIQRTGDLSATLRDLAKRYGVVIVDAGGRDSRELRSALTVAALLLIPTKASQADLETMPKMQELVTLARGFNPDLQALAVVSMAPANSNGREVAEARELLAEFDAIGLAETVIRDRKVFRDALLEGAGVVELANGQAKAEIQLLASEFFDADDTTA